MSNLLEHAKRELDLLGLPEPSDYNEDTEQWDPDAAMRIGILDIIFNFSQQGHSGFSAQYAIGCLEKLLRYENLTPLTDDPDEWIEVQMKPDEELWQSRRNPACFSPDRGRTYYHLDEHRKLIAAISNRLPWKLRHYLRDTRPYMFYPMHYTEPNDR